MLSLGAGLAHGFESLKQRLPSWRERAPDPSPVLPRGASPVAIATLIESQIIPRLLVSHRPAIAEPRRPSPVPQPIAAGDAEAFAALVLARDVAELAAHVDSLMARGVTFDAVLVDLFAPAARRLGALWDEDLCDFVDVTMGLWRLQELVHELAGLEPVAPAGASRKALFAVFPGEQHMFGLLLVEELFRAAGWSTSACIEGNNDELVANVREQWLDLIGLTISNDESIGRAPALIDALRRSSRNPDVVVMAGGRTLSDRPELAFAIGADGTAPDARKAVARAEFLVETLASADASRS